MMHIRCLHLVAPAFLAVTLAHAQSPKAKVITSSDWNRIAAAQYLDAREQWWMDWPKAQQDHDTVCVSCHTAVPYAMSRAALHATSVPAPLSPQEARMLGYVTRRVTLWQEVKPFYLTEERGPRKSEESRGTEAVMNALILTRYDEPSGQLREITKEALQNMWSLQIKSGDEAGSWDWINFHNAPWESDESHYWGATLGAVAYGSAPASYRRRPDVQAKISLLRAYLAKDYDKQPLMNRISVLWASGRMPGLLTRAQRESLLKDIALRQQQDGGWTTATLGPWKRKDGTPVDAASDGYATALVVYAMHESGIPAENGLIQAGRRWLVKNQAADGRWNAASLNKQREASADPAKFMSDAATAYAAMALTSIPER
jgi:squalene-hopene/tetraprenyl-beta-curcumene cyclase